MTGLQGRPAKPTIVKKLQGTFNPSDSNKHEVTPSKAIPVMPRGLSPKGKRLWKAYSEKLYSYGLLTELDGLAFEMLVRTFCTIEQLIDDVEEEGHTVSGIRGIMRNPSSVALDSQLKIFLMFCREFGMTPGSRSRLEVKDQASVSDYRAFLDGSVDIEYG